jgi:DNA mismatch repair protein MutS
VSDENKRIDFISFLKEIGDLERLISKVAALRVSPRELVHLKKSLVIISKLKTQIKTSNNSTLQSVAEQLNPCEIICERLQNELNEDAPISVLKGNVFNKGINVELDELRNIAFNGKDYLLQIQKREIEKTGITSLKVAFNSVFGYYLEVTHLHKDKVPQDWIRKQTLTNAERYITPELKTYEEKILGAEEKIMSIEQELFEKLVNDISEYIAPIQLNANLLAKLDVLCGFATLSIENNYHCPKINEGFAIEIKEGRHPVIEKQLPIGINYVSNSVYLDNDNTQIMMITGPNMSGKSALLRQTALIVLLAQIGCYVPAEEANLSIIDKIFTRVGATDNMSSGESTFMVEMNETASILNNLSARSLVLLDEIGRGTSTYDGISIAWSIAEFIHNQPINRAKTLFATHYHELNDMANLFLRIKNYNVTIKESANKIIFLRKLAEGGSAHSFGIHVARMAGMPNYVVDRANEILKKLEKNRDFELETIDDLTVSGGMSITPQNNKDMQLSFFQLNDPILNKIKEDILAIDINTLTPVEALLKLNEIKRAFKI